ncbi:MAG: M13 family metallopeptidase, partial [Bacteroidales bacterium]|nr:M13 family metallopeptidase [Bacteroidales bacterium]
MKKLIWIMIPLMMLAACQNKGTAEKVPAIDLNNLDTSVAPGEDFYKYATHGWQVANPLGAEYARFGSFDKLRENNVTRLNDLFASMTTMKTKKGSVEQKIVDLYKQGLDSTRLNAEGAAPLQKYIAEVQAIETKTDFAKQLGKMHLEGEGSIFGAYVEADLMDSDNQILYMGQGGLGIGDRDYYLKAENSAIKEGYRLFLNKVLALAGIENAQAVADNTVAVEEYLAQNSWTREEERDYMKLYNPMSTEEIIAAYPGFDFAAFFEACGIPAQDKIIVCEQSFFKALSSYVENTDLQVLKDYMLAHLVSGGCGALSDDFYAAHFDFYSRQMAGIQEHKPRWKRAMAVPNGVLGEAVGKMYVKKYFPESSKKQMVALVKNLQIALGQHIDSLDWMGAETKVKAHEKLDNFTVKIGYPDKWKDYSTLEVDPEKSYYENHRAASRWYIADNLSKLGKPTDKTEWGMTPQTVNAYYNPTTNEICFPAAILQKPFFDPDADEPVNYGGIGVVIGHEMSHGFDDQGSMFDANGNMINWWTEEDKAKFDALGDKLVAQFDEVEIVPGVHANGRYTLGENIGDHGGLSIAFTAMENAVSGEDPMIDGFTRAQRFYLSYGAIWAQNIRDEEKVRLTNLDVHSLAVNRVNVSLRNFQTFFDAFDIREGDPMFRPE